jgi:hypothetical protein
MRPHTTTHIIRSWDVLQSNYLQCKADLDKLLQEKALVDRKLVLY